MKRAAHVGVTQRQLQRAKTMRMNMAEMERKLWRGLRQRLPLEGTYFRRQVPIAGFVTDFCCHALKLVIEVDGNQHGTEEAQAFDAKRSAAIEVEGYRVLRFSNHDVLRSLDSVLDTIAAAAGRTPTPGPSPQGGGEETAHG